MEEEWEGGREGGMGGEEEIGVEDVRATDWHVQK
jgi:hypothetical protein